ncbi:(2Fe-2S) ferredoxin domain-containing protein [Thermobifida halotolerans]|uniref:(2Fe-2S) ferredoxin domain-containing protein n=1 Tax=Thermobifida halotolerans TaxID=483545 RepID=UPI003516E942
MARLGALRDHEDRAVPVRVSTCLGICFRANVVVVQPSARGRAAGGRPVWLGDFTEDRLIGELDDWIFAGGPGLAALPPALRPHLTGKDAKKPKKDGKRKAKKSKKNGKRKAEETRSRATEKPEKGKKRKKGKKGKRAGKTAA